MAAHLEPEILLVDEVLAVGDVAFQQKCLGKMKDVSSSGRTVVGVSHNVAAITRLCLRCLVLSAGQVRFDGDTRTAITQYYLPAETCSNDATYVAPLGQAGPHLMSARVKTSGPTGDHDHGEPVGFEFEMAVPRPCQGLCFSFQVVNEFSSLSVTSGCSIQITLSVRRQGCIGYGVRSLARVYTWELIR